MYFFTAFYKQRGPTEPGGGGPPEEDYSHADTDATLLSLQLTSLLLCLLTVSVLCLLASGIYTARNNARTVYVGYGRTAGA